MLKTREKAREEKQGDSGMKRGRKEGRFFCQRREFR
jgi:hypothetical protein